MQRIWNLNYQVVLFRYRTLKTFLGSLKEMGGCVFDFTWP